MPCMAHVLNLVVQGDLKELGNSSSTSFGSKSEGDEECEEDEVEVTSQRPFGAILCRLRKLVLAENSKPQRIHQYKELCESYKMSNISLLNIDVPTMWTSTYAMITTAWDKRKVLNTMATTCLKGGKGISLIMSEEWDLLKIFADELLAFKEATEMFSQSKAITSPNGTSIFYLLLNQLYTSIIVLGNPSQGVMGRPMSIEQSMRLKGAYIVMKTKLLKYEPQVKRKPIFPIATMLDPSLKFEYIPMDEQEYITKTLKHSLQLMHAPPISSAYSQSEPLSNTSMTCLKMMVELMKCKRKKNINILLEKPISDEIFDYFHDSQVECSHLDALQWWCKIGSEKYPRLAMLEKGFLSVCASSSPLERLFSSGRGIITYKRGKLFARTISILMTLKSWGKTDEADTDEEEFGEDTN